MAHRGVEQQAAGVGESGSPQARPGLTVEMQDQPPRTPLQATTSKRSAPSCEAPTYSDHLSTGAVRSPVRRPAATRRQRPADPDPREPTRRLSPAPSPNAQRARPLATAAHHHTDRTGGAPLSWTNVFERKIKPLEMVRRLRVSVKRSISGTSCGGRVVGRRQWCERRRRSVRRCCRRAMDVQVVY